MKEIILHICCAPDATHVSNVLRENFSVTGYFYNPCIEPADEYERRKSGCQILVEKALLPIEYGGYDVSGWRNSVAGFEDEPEGGKRCGACIQIRLEETARFAVERKIKLFTTTLTVSPHKNALLINKIGLDIAEKLGIEFLVADFKKKDGFKISVDESRKMGIYRQNYCGCIYSISRNLTHSDPSAERVPRGWVPRWMP